MGKDSRDTPKFNDNWSYVHFMFGIYFYIILVKLLNYNFKNGFIKWNYLHFIYELKDVIATYIFKTDSKHGFINNSSWYNSIGDTLCSMIGFVFSYYLFKLPIVNYNYLLILIMSIPVIVLAIEDYLSAKKINV